MSLPMLKITHQLLLGLSDGDFLKYPLNDRTHARSQSPIPTSNRPVLVEATGLSANMSRLAQW